MKDLDVANTALKGFLLSAFCFAFLDVWFLNLFYVQDPDIRAIWKHITYLGDSEWMLIGSLVLGSISYGMYRFRRKNRIKHWWRWRIWYRMSVFVFASVAITGIFASLTKYSIGRARPQMIEEFGPFAFDPFAFDAKWAAWPSGHTTTAFAMATALAIIVPRYRPVFFLFAGIAGISRAVLGAHYISDVIMGATVGTVGTVLIYRWFGRKLLNHTYPHHSHAGDSRESDIVS